VQNAAFGNEGTGSLGISDQDLQARTCLSGTFRDVGGHLHFSPVILFLVQERPPAYGNRPPQSM